MLNNQLHDQLVRWLISQIFVGRVRSDAFARLNDSEMLVLVGQVLAIMITGLLLSSGFRSDKLDKLDKVDKDSPLSPTSFSGLALLLNLHESKLLCFGGLPTMSASKSSSTCLSSTQNPMTRFEGMNDAWLVVFQEPLADILFPSAI